MHKTTFSRRWENDTGKIFYLYITMNKEEFYDLVERARNAAKLYYKTRDHAALQEAKKLENEIDKEIARYKQEKLQPNLFM